MAVHFFDSSALDVGASMVLISADMALNAAAAAEGIPVEDPNAHS